MSKSKSKAVDAAAAAAEEAEVRYDMARGLLQAAGIGPAAVAEAALVILAGAAVGREEFVQGLRSLVVTAGRVQDGWDAAEDDAKAAAGKTTAAAAEVECNCRSCRLRKAAEGGPVVVEYATEEEAERLLSAYGEGS
jgi:hypothetical protein